MYLILLHPLIQCQVQLLYDYLDAELPIHMADKFHPEVFKIDGVYNNN